MAKKRTTNRRGEGRQLRDEIIEAARELLDASGDDTALSLRAVARKVGVAATSVYLHFADQDALLEAVMETTFARMMESVDAADAAPRAPADKLRARILALAEWAQAHFGLFKVLHESTLHMRRDLAFMKKGGTGATEAIQRCIDAGVAPPGEAKTIALDLRAAVHGMVTGRLNQPYLEWPSLEEQLERFLTKLVGIPPKSRARRSTKG
ncbi:MAG: TetR/AcrR family transcriptional regulator [Kofleriaceae bacterium]